MNIHTAVTAAAGMFGTGMSLTKSVCVTDTLQELTIQHT